MGVFRVAHPGVRVRVLEPEEGTDIADLVRTGRVELALADLPVRDAALESAPLATQDLLAACPPGTKLRKGRAVIADLAATPLIATPPGTSTRLLLEAARPPQGRP